MNMFQMLVMSFEGTALAAITPFGWVPVAVLIAVGVAAERRADADESDIARQSKGRWVAELATLAIIPLALVVAATVLTVPPHASTRDIQAVEYVLYAVLAVQTLLGAGLIWRHRLRRMPTVVTAVAFTLWAAGATFIATMAITDNWL